VILGPAEALRAFTVGGSGRVDVLGDVGAADESHCLNVRVVHDGVDGLLVAMHHLKDALGKSRFEK
jgi:hypothetical protein